MGTAVGISSTGFVAGAATGTAVGFAGGFDTNSGNAWMDNANLGEGLWSGIKGGGIGALAGGVLGGTIGGIDDFTKKRNVLKGKGDLDLSSGFGAHGIDDLNHNITGKYVGKYEGVYMYESKQVGYGSGSGGIALPGRGIIVGKGAFSNRLAMDLVHHEYGHILQARKVGYVAFYHTIAKESLRSEERRVGKESRDESVPEIQKKHVEE